LKGTSIEDAPIIPVSAQQRINLSYLIEVIEERIPTPHREENKDPYMLVVRSFDINKPGTPPKKLKGGVLGGALVEGKFKLGQEIEIRPGARINEKYKILNTKIVGLQKVGKNLEEAGPGGLLGVMTELDPFLTKSDFLVGNVVGLSGKLPEIREKISIKFNLLERVIGTERLEKVEPIKKGETLLINAGVARSIGIVENIREKVLELDLKIPICIKNEKIVISRRIADRWRLIGYGSLI
jgi:translation initiation factor 2 subunit 3